MKNKQDLFGYSLPETQTKTTQVIADSIPRKLLKPSRNQVFMQSQTLDEQLPLDHEARIVWQFVETLDLLKFKKRIFSLEGCDGRAAIDPRILIALWIYAILDGVVVASKIAQYCKENIAYSWISGEVSAQRHVLAKFRAQNADLFEELIVQSVTLLVDKGLVTLKEVSQDGVKVKASAAKSSMHRKRTLCEKAIELNKHIKKLEKEEKSHRLEKVELARKKREISSYKEKMKRVIDAAKEINQHKETMNATRQNNGKKKLSNKEVSKLRASTTDPECRKMKMADKSVQCAYNFQIAVETGLELVLKTSVRQSSSDTGTMLPMFNSLKELYALTPKKYLVDSAYIKRDDLVSMFLKGCSVYSPTNKSTALTIKKRVFSKKESTSAEKEFILRMSTLEAQKIYNKRIRTSETINAFIRNRGLSHFMIRGLRKVKGMIDLICLTYNLQIIKRLYPSVLLP
jgi:transposase